ncbi:MAG: RDD family protein [Opitutaceae bacterium]|jgi:uncharacterized RDD family membrane protein YckC
MNPSARDLFRGAIVALSFALALSLLAQEAPPPASATVPVAAPSADSTPATTPAPATAQSVSPTKTEAATSPAAAAPETKAELRRPDTPSNTATATEGQNNSVSPARPAVEAGNAAKPSEIPAPTSGDQKTEKTLKEHFPVGTCSGKCPPFGDHTVPAGTTQSAEAVSFWGTNTVDGELSSKAVSVFGKTVVNGRTNDDAVALFGNLEVNGHVSGKTVALFGNLKLGENAIVDGDVVVVFGNLDQHPGAIVHGQVNKIMSCGNIPHRGAIVNWVKKCLLFGRLLGFGEGLGWAWIVAGAHLVFYVLLALIFRSGMVKCAETLEQRPVRSIFTAFLAIILTPLVIVLLAITGIGALLIPFLAAGLFFAGWFGRAAMHAWFGRLVTRHFGDSPSAHIAVSVLVGGVIISLLYCVPVLGLCMHFLIGSLGLGMVITVLILNIQKERPATPFAASPAQAGSPPVSPTAPAAAVVPNFASTMPLHGSPSPTAVLGSLPIFSAAPTPPPPPLPTPASALPRAGFWQRMGALGVDVVLCGILTFLIGSLLHAVPFLRIGSGIGFSGFLLLLTTYGAVMWKLRGTTIGGIIFQLKIVRLDERPLDWMTAIVRSLSCFLSLVVAGLGFIWIALDHEGQSWHDKIAGTVVVCPPKGPSLV